MSGVISEESARRRVLWLSTAAFTLLFNVWLMLGVLSIPIRKELALSPAQLEWLMAIAILAGAAPRLHFGMWADRYGGRNMMVALLAFVAVPTYLFSRADSFAELLICTALCGLAGNSFTVGIAWNSAWFPKEKKGAALGIFGAGNVGAAGTKALVFFVPGILTFVPAAGLLGGFVPGGWRAIPAMYAALLVLMAAAIWLIAPKVDPKPAKGRTTRELLKPLREARVWRFSLYYVVVFGAYVAMSAWLPKFYVDEFELSLRTASLLALSYILPASLLRPLGGYLSDRYGPRVVTYSVFVVMIAALAALNLPFDRMFASSSAAYVFAGLVFVVGCAMGVGKASVYKYVADFYPQDVGAVGGLVGALGGLGGFVLPVLFGAAQRYSGSPQAALTALLFLTVASLAWLQTAIWRTRAESAEAIEADSALGAQTAS